MEGCNIVLNPVADQTMSAVLSAPLPSPTHRAAGVGTDDGAWVGDGVGIHPLRMFRDVPPCILYSAIITGPVQSVFCHGDPQSRRGLLGVVDFVYKKN